MTFPAVDGTHGFARGVWNMLRDGGTWAVPRSGLVYQKREDAKQLALISRMPWMEGMPFPEEHLHSFQDDDHEGVEKIFAAIGIRVTEDP